VGSPDVAAPAATHARAVRAWCLYDWANSAFATTVMAAMYPPFFRALATSAGIPSSRATALWGYTVALSLAVVALAGPLLGAFADLAGARKRFLAGAVVIGAGATAATVLVGSGDWRLAAVLFILGAVGFAGGNVFYESLLPSLASRDELDRVSARGYAFGYLGGGLLLVLNALWVLAPQRFGLADQAAAVRASFLSVAVWWALFSLPLFRSVPEPPAAAPPGTRITLLDGLRRLAAGLAEAGRRRQLLAFLVAFWLYNDGITTIIKMATAYGDELGIGLGHMVAALVLTQVIGVPCSLLFGRLAGPLGARRAIQLGLAVYAAITVAGAFMSRPWHFYLLAAAVGTVQGGTQALSRSLFAAMVPRHRTAELFGFFSTSEKLAGIVGPLLFAVATDLSGSARPGIAALVVLFVAGALLLGRVDVEAGIREARAGEAGA
jgi:MFS transporter, UMF1 family